MRGPRALGGPAAPEPPGSLVARPDRPGPVPASAARQPLADLAPQPVADRSGGARASWGTASVAPKSSGVSRAGPAGRPAPVAAPPGVAWPAVGCPVETSPVGRAVVDTVEAGAAAPGAAAPGGGGPGTGGPGVPPAVGDPLPPRGPAARAPGPRGGR